MFRRLNQFVPFGLACRYTTTSSRPSGNDFYDETSKRTKLSLFPCQTMLTPVQALSENELCSPNFMQRLWQMNQVATELQMLCISGPKFHWPVPVILLKSSVDGSQYETWVNPAVPDYDSRTSIAPMYGMWENCASCGHVYAWVVRPQSIHVSGLDEYGRAKHELLTGIRARLLMHEMDHLRGTTMLQHTTSPDFVCSGNSIFQKELWPANFPSAEAYATPILHFFDYTTNNVIVAPGMEWVFQMANGQMQFTKPPIPH